MVIGGCSVCHSRVAAQGFFMFLMGSRKRKFVEMVKIIGNFRRSSKLNEYLLQLQVQIMMLNFGAKSGQVMGMEIVSAEVEAKPQDISEFSPK